MEQNVPGHGGLAALGCSIWHGLKTFVEIICAPFWRKSGKKVADSGGEGSNTPEHLWIGERKYYFDMCLFWHNQDPCLSISTSQNSERSCALQDRGEAIPLLIIHNMESLRTPSCANFHPNVFCTLSYLPANRAPLCFLASWNFVCFFPVAERAEKVFSLVGYWGFILWLSYKENPLLGKISFGIFLSCNRISLSRKHLMFPFKGIFRINNFSCIFFFCLFPR